jgi:hypothetical protein
MMRNPVDLAHLFAEHWDEPSLLEVFQQMGAVPMQSGAAR